MSESKIKKFKKKGIQKKSDHFRSKISKKIFLWHQAVHIINCGSTSLCDQNCGCTAADRHTHTQTHGQTKV